MQTRNFKIFTVYDTIFGQFMTAFHFFKLHEGNRSPQVEPSEKARCLTLDLRKVSFCGLLERRQQ